MRMRKDARHQRSFPMRRTFLSLALALQLATLAATPLHAETLVLVDITPAALIERIETMQLSAKNIPSETKQRQFLTDAESLKAQIAKIEDFQSASEAAKLRIANGYESLRERADGIVAKNERRRCERVRRTGSNMVTRVCMTEAQWAQRSESARDSMTEMQRKTPDYGLNR
jgi:hypothetical protein